LELVVIRQREFLGRHKHQLALVADLGVLALALVLEHSGLGHGEMADTDMGEAISMCLAIVEAGAVLIGASALLRTRPRFAPAAHRMFVGPVVAVRAAGVRIPSARAGPSLLQVFRS
jgi:hypothetical protein